MTVTIDGALGVTTPKVTYAGVGTCALLPPTTAGVYTQNLPAGNGTLVLTTVIMNFPTTLGNSGDVLTTNGSGNLYWAPGGSGTGSVTSVGAATVAGMGLSFTGGPITAAGTLTLSGVLNPSNGGTGLSALGTGVQAALAANTGSAGGLLVANGSGFLPIAQGGTGAGTAAGAANNLLPAQSAPQAGYVLSTDGAGNLSWVSNAAALDVGSSAITSGTAGSILIEDVGNVLGEILMGSGVAAALAANAGAANGFATLNASGVLPLAQGGIGGPVNSSWTTILGAAAGTGVGAALGTAVGTAGSFVVNGGVLGTPSSGTLTNCSGLPLTTGVTGILPISNGGTNLSALGTAGQVLAVNAGATALQYVTPSDDITVGTTTVTSGSPDAILFDNSGVVGALAVGAAGTAIVSNGTNISYGYPDQSAGVTGGNAWEVLYQDATNSTNFVPAGVTDQILSSNTGAAPSWINNSVSIGTTVIKVGDPTATTVINDLVTLKLTQDPTSGLEAATKQYVDAKTAGLQDIGVAKAATTGNITRSGAQTIDGVSLVAGDICLVKDQTNSAEDGLYVVAAGAWTYATTANTWADYPSAVVFVQGGTTNANTSWIQTDQTVGGTLGTTPMSWVLQSSPVTAYSAGTGISIATNIISNAGVISFDGGATGLTPTGAATGAITLGGTLAIAHGGTGLTALGTGVQTALSQNMGTANGFAQLNGSGVLPISQGGLGGVVDTSWTSILSAAAGAGVGTALGTAVGTAGSFVVNGGALGTPSSGALTNCTGLPLTTGVTGVLPIANGGTGLSALGTAGQVLTVNPGATAAVWATPTTTGTVTSVAQTFTGGLISVAGSPITTAGTLALTVAGTSGGIPYFSSGSTWASSAVLAANALVIGGGAGGAPATTTTGTGVIAALGNATNSANGMLVANGAGLLPITQGGTGLGALGTAGQVLTVNPGATAAVWATPASSGTVTSVGLSFTGGVISVTPASTPVTTAGTLALTVAGNSGGIPYFDTASSWATSAVLAANSIMLGGGAGAAPATTTTGTGVVTAIGNAVNTAGGLATCVSAFTAGSVVFSNGTALNQDNANFFWDDANNRLGLATAAPAVTLDAGTATDAIALPKGTTAQRPSSPAKGYVRFNTTTNEAEIFDGTNWVSATPGAYTAGSVLFAGSTGQITEDNAKFFWDDTADQMIIGANATITSPTNIQLAVTKDAYVNGITVGRGGGQVATNTVVGAGAQAASGGTNNVAVGDNALAANTANYNVAVGSVALQSNTIGAGNVAVGANSLITNTAGNQITAVGGGALYFNTASNNTAVGNSALSSNTIGTPNTAVGVSALYANQIGTNNVAVGDSALAANTGSLNTAVGSGSLQAKTTGTTNAAFGSYALANLTNGSNNAAFGDGSGASLITGSNNSYIGSGANNSSATVSNELVVSSTASGTSPGKGTNTGFINPNGGGVYQGNNSNTWSVTSDERIKEEITDVSAALATINALRPVHFKYKLTGKADTSFIAQEYMQVLPSHVEEHTASPEEKELTGSDTLYGLSSNLTPYLVAAVKELSAKNEALEARLAALESK